MGTYRDDPDLVDVMRQASFEDMRILIDILTDKGEGRVTLDPVAEALMKKSVTAGSVDEATLVGMAGEIQRYGANTFMTLFRGGKGVLYKEIVCDVASHVKATYNEKQEISQIEHVILLQIVEKSLDRMSEEERMKFFNEFGVHYKTGAVSAAMAALIAAIRLSGFAAYKLATIVAAATAKAILGRGLTFAATNGLMKGMGAFAGPVGWAITGIWTAFDLASPAYRVTVPCVIQIAYMRQKMLAHECPACHEVTTKGTKFCPECGHRMV